MPRTVVLVDDHTMLRQGLRRALEGELAPPGVAFDRVLVGTTANAIYALEASTGRTAWRWLTGADVVGADGDRNTVFFASLDNIIRGVNRGNGNQRWIGRVATRPGLPPRLVTSPRRLVYDPVVLVESGHSFERQALEDWWAQGHRMCPKTGTPLRSKALSVAPNVQLREAERVKLVNHTGMQTPSNASALRAYQLLSSGASGGGTILSSATETAKFRVV